MRIEPEWIRAGGIFLAFVVCALLVGLVWTKLFDKLVQKSRSSLDDIILSAIRSLVMWALILAGGYNAFLEVSASQHNTVIWPMIGKGFSIAWIVLAIVTTLRLFGAFARWRMDKANETAGESVRDVITRVTFVRKLLSAVVILFGGLYLLSVTGIDISPIIAGGALSGIVIGIALQDTLSNIFAGFFLNFDRPIKIGDFIRLDTNQEGYVEDVGWRYSRIRLLGNNLLIVPNSKLSQSVITNYSLPTRTLSISVPCTVSYDNDLDKVEEIAVQVASEVQHSIDGKESEWEPQVRFKEFGATSISMVTVLRSNSVGAQNRLQHQFIKALHKAFRESGVKVT